MARHFTTQGAAGSEQHVDFGTSSTINPPAVTVSCWGNFGQINAADNLNVVNNVDSTNSVNIYLMRLVAGASNFRYIVAVSHSTIVSVVGTATTAANVWNHLAMTYDSTNGLKGFANGAADGTAAANGTILSDNAGSGLFTGGDKVFGTTAGLTFSTADLAMWNTSLTSSEISALFQGARPGTIRNGNLVLWSPLIGRSPEPDYSGKVLNGTVVNSSTVVSDPPFNMFTPRWPQFPAPVVTSVIFRKTLSQIGGRIGTRQQIGWGM